MLENWDDDDDDDDDNCNIMTTNGETNHQTGKWQCSNQGFWCKKNDEKHKILLATTVAQPEKLTDAKF